MIRYCYECTNNSFVNLANRFKEHAELAWLQSENSLDSPSFLFLLPSKQILIRQTEQSPWQELKEKISFYSNGSSIPRYVGYLCYEMGSSTHTSSTLANFKTPIPLAYFFKAAVVCKYFQNSLEIFIFDEDFDFLEQMQQKLFQKLIQEDFWENLLKTSCSFEFKALQMCVYSQSDSIESYQEKIRQAKKYIVEGDVYQVNISRSVTLNTSNHAFDIFNQLLKINQTPFSALLNYSDFQIISASPECFLTFDGKRLKTRPIKGTIQRGKTPLEDQALYQKLLHCEKEDAELMMICDLMRNDLGKVSEIGSVRCEVLKKVLKLSNVFHLESTITSTPKKMHPIDLLRSAFPAGSISGCPKLRALEIIQEIEQRPRHIYCGAIGYFTSHGHFNFNVAIRTALLQEKKLQIQVGGAITTDSDLLAEYEETFYKGSPFFKAFDNQAETKDDVFCKKNQQHFLPNQRHYNLKKPSIHILDTTLLNQ